MAEDLFDRALELVMDGGQTLLANGGEVFRVQQTMEIMAASLGVQDFHVYVLTNGIFASAHLPGGESVVPAVSANAAIIGALMVLTPGVALTMGVRDILNGDYLSGSIRLLDALLIAGSIAGGVVLGWIVAHGLGVA